MRTALLALSLLSLAACTSPPGEDPKDSDTPPDDTSGDTDTPREPSALEITASLSEEIVTVVHVSWRTDEPTTGYVEFGESSDYGWSTPLEAEASTEHEALLLGLPAETEAHLRVVLQEGDDSWASADHAITTGSLPPEVPELSATSTATSWSGFQVVPVQGTSYAIVIIDTQGRVVWYDLLESGANLMRAFFSVDGESMVYCLAGPQNDLEAGEIRRVSMDGLDQTSIAFPFIDHDMVELPDGTITAIVVDEREVEVDGEEHHTSADLLVEMAPDGSMTTIWDAWEHWDPVELGLLQAHNWTHTNAIDYDPEADEYTLSLKEPGSIVRVSRTTGEVLWQLNGMLNQFTFPPETDIVQMSHQFEMLDDGILIFDNGPQERGYSRAVELELDIEALQATETWSYRHDPDVYVFAKGDVARFPDGNTQVVWSSGGEIQNVTPEGEVTWQLNTDLGDVITFVDFAESLYVTP